MRSTSLRSRVGSLFHVGIPAPQLDAATRQTLVDLQVGGVILFRRNAGTPEQMTALASALHALPSRPLLSIDHEGGRVMRLGEPFTHFPPAAAIGRRGDTRIAEQVGRAMAAELTSIGIDLSFAPVLDVHSNPANPVIGDRAFSADPHLVAELGVAMMRGLHAGGMISCGKHFPGHGDTAVDSHHELPVVNKIRADLERTELVPFRAAIGAGVPMLMTAHVVYTGLDAVRPATMSPIILGDLLRGELGFDGVVVSDDLDMRAITDHQSAGAAAVATLNAGADLLLVCQDLAHAVAAVAAIEAGLESGAVSEERLQQASQRIEQLRRRLRPTTQRCTLPNEEHRALAEQLRRA
jgi:beta-N-acetylhexosaminidase